MSTRTHPDATTPGEISRINLPKWELFLRAFVALFGVVVVFDRARE